MDENPYQAPLAELSVTKRPSMLLWFGGWFFIFVGAFCFVPGVIMSLAQFVLGIVPIWTAAIGGVLMFGLSALSFWIGNRMRREGNGQSK